MDHIHRRIAEEMGQGDVGVDESDVYHNRFHAKTYSQKLLTCFLVLKKGKISSE